MSRRANCRRVVAHTLADARLLCRTVNDLMTAKDERPRDFTKVCVFSGNVQRKVHVRMRLVRDAKGTPHHFECILREAAAPASGSAPSSAVPAAAAGPAGVGGLGTPSDRPARTEADAIGAISGGMVPTGHILGPPTTLLMSESTDSLARAAVTNNGELSQDDFEALLMLPTPSAK